MTVSATDVRDLIGVASTVISDTIIDRLVTEAQNLVEGEVGGSFSVLEEIEAVTGDRDRRPKDPRTWGTRGWREIRVSKKYLLKVIAISDDDQTLDVSKVIFDRETRSIRLTDESEINRFFAQDAKRVRIQYLHGLKMPTRASGGITKLSNAESAGTSVALNVDDDVSSTISVNDYVWINGINGKAEAAKVTAITASLITVDEIKYDHSSGALVRQLVNDERLEQLVKVIAAISALFYASGSKQNASKRYKLGEFEVEKDFKYREDMVNLIRERDRLFNSLRTFEAI